MTTRSLEDGPIAVSVHDEYVARVRWREPAEPRERRVRVLELNGVTATLVEVCDHLLGPQTIHEPACIVCGRDAKPFASRLTFRDGAWRMGSGYTAAVPT